MRNSDARIRRLETLQPRERCLACGNWPTRLVGIDENTGGVISETMPETGCPACGRPPRSTREIVGVDVADVIRPAEKNAR